MNIGELKAEIESIVEFEDIQVSMLIATGGIEIATHKKSKKGVAPVRPRVYVEIQSHMTVGKFEMTLGAANRLTPDVLDAQILFGLKKARKGETHVVE